MYFSDIVTLRLETKTLDSYGDPVSTFTDTSVFADKQSVKRSEYYTANMAGISIDAVFVVHAEDFNNQTVVTVPATAAKATVKAASAITDTLTITIGTGVSTLKVLLTTAGTDALAVTKSDPDDGTINIALAKTTPAKNTAALIQTAIRALTTVNGVSVTAAACEAGGNWDTAAVATGETESVNLTGIAAANYEIVRSYQKGEGTVELMCRRRD